MEHDASAREANTPFAWTSTCARASGGTVAVGVVVVVVVAAAVVVV
jgi:hypothetical protein